MARDEYEERGRSDLVKAITGALPIDPEDGTCVMVVTRRGHLVWGDPRELAHRILDALDEAYTNRDLQTEWHMMVNAEREDPF
jgi:hypothetical protein